MYTRYRSDYTPHYRYSYPRYGYGTSYSYDTSPYYDDFYYSYGRRRPYYWEREREMYNNWRRNRPERRPRTPSPDPPPPPPKPEVPKEELVKELHVKGIDLHITENTEKHRTDEYECTKGKIKPAELVLRRGQSFKMTVTFDRPYSKPKNDLQLCFSLGEHPTGSGGTKVQFTIDESGKEKFKPDEWGATWQGSSENNITAMVHVPANCIIGEWNFYVKTISEGKDKDGEKKKLESRNFELDYDITIIFNPWCKEDGVYMATENLLDEYVLNESSAVWTGNHHQPWAKPWNFGQFQDGILEIALHVVRSGFRPDMLKPMSDPVRVSRIIAKMVNSSDDNGVLSGRWDDEYGDGTPPGHWTGSVKILKQWFESGPVRYGQCWVFSGVTTTVCRALGIPCRSVTNFSSAHDTNQTNCIEKYFQPGDDINDSGSDSIWNFHVWNEAWMARPNLQDEFPYGWQVIDATPQERSEGVYTCGPCPVAAVRKGLCRTEFDSAFVFSEVNADEVHWRMLPNGRYELMKVLKDEIGKKISTKTPTGEPFEYPHEADFYQKERYGNENRLDLTLEYKPQEGTEEERESVLNALRTAFKPLPANYVEREKAKLVKFKLEQDSYAMIGGKMDIKVTAKNTGTDVRKIIVAVIAVYPESYTGHHGKILHRKKFDGAILKKGEEKVFKTVLEPKEYMGHLDEQSNVSVVATASVERVGDEDYVYRKEHIVRFRRPDLEVKGPKEATDGEMVTFNVSFTNPLDQPLTGCNISMESIGFKDFDNKPCEKNIDAKGIYEETFEMKALKPKRYAAVYFTFECEEIKNITGMAVIRIHKQP
ncbi:annulin-like isoform X2 [Mercenaria mercenaria]|nr:annulin-like isoform X2 [Mercenaria mercenaria]XP_045192040.2 annulin-like isoform X2 [Mercenaria mercenaria]XP_045192043.2 annulin-like isoform X2 [Mercenaria mercenaria]XP_053402254.1 annulin-like isoform X2 [Mercenaria mercenaria]